MSIDLEWESFINGQNINVKKSVQMPSTAPQSSPIYISTKSKIAYLNAKIPLNEIFWQIPVIPYDDERNGIIKKQIKVVCNNHAEIEEVRRKLSHYAYYDEQVIQHIENPGGLIPFKDSRKISIGISSKDILSYKLKKKSAFDNCFVIIMRMMFEGLYREIHVKIFNTGKIKIPGIQSVEMYDEIKRCVVEHLTPFFPDIKFNENSDENVLINSNFTCGYLVDREKLYKILKNKYNIDSIYDPCSYPGIQCKFYYNKHLKCCITEQTGTSQNFGTVERPTKQSPSSKKVVLVPEHIVDVSFMIFRTGSILIVGKCEDEVLLMIYDFICKMMRDEYGAVAEGIIPYDEGANKENQNKRKLKKKMVEMTEEQLNACCFTRA